MAVGIKAATIFLFNTQSLMSLFQYKTTTAKTAPTWIEISNVFKNELSAKLKALDARIRWAVEETGRNSVMPSMMPKITA